VSETFVYIVECADGSFYTGWTTDPDRRLREHNTGRGARYTRSRRPLKLAYLEPQPDRAAAMRRERRIKTYTRDQKMALIDSYQGPDPS
jgi:putative endonuclease